MRRTRRTKRYGHLGRGVLALVATILLPLACGPATDAPPADPAGYAAILHPTDNPPSPAVAALGRELFFDPILSGDSTVSCASCHRPELAFADGRTLSAGINGRLGRRNSPGLANVGYLHRTLFWDGRASGLEAQALHPIADPNEMGGDWPTTVHKLRRHPDYGPAFRAAFGLDEARQLTPDHVGRALAQFQRTLVSNDSKYDRVLRGEATYTAAEELGHAIFFDLADEPDPRWRGTPTGECAHCHIAPHFTNQRFFNTGLEEAPTLTEFTDIGRGAVTGSRYDNGKFRVPGLRNLALTAPYMHDGRMATLAEVIDHYNNGGHYAENRDPLLYAIGLNNEQQSALEAFLLTLTDSAFVLNPAYRPAR